MAERKVSAVFPMFDTVTNLSKLAAVTKNMNAIVTPYENPAVAAFYFGALKLARGDVSEVIFDTYRESAQIVAELFRGALKYISKRPAGIPESVAENARLLLKGIVVRTVDIPPSRTDLINADSFVLRRTKMMKMGNRFEPVRVVISPWSLWGTAGEEVHANVGVLNLESVMYSIGYISGRVSPEVLQSRVKYAYIDTFGQRIESMIKSILRAYKAAITDIGSTINIVIDMAHRSAFPTKLENDSEKLERYNAVKVGIHNAFVNVIKNKIPIIMRNEFLPEVEVVEFPTTGTQPSMATVSTAIRLEGEGFGSIGIETDKGFEGREMPERIDLVPKTYVDMLLPVVASEEEEPKAVKGSSYLFEPEIARRTKEAPIIVKEKMRKAKELFFGRE